MLHIQRTSKYVPFLMMLGGASATLAGEHGFVILHHDIRGCSVVSSHRIVDNGVFAESSMFRVGAVYPTEAEANAALVKIPECRESQP
jgi:hypothetical protein